MTDAERALSAVLKLGRARLRLDQLSIASMTDEEAHAEWHAADVNFDEAMDEIRDLADQLTGDES